MDPKLNTSRANTPNDKYDKETNNGKETEHDTDNENDNKNSAKALSIRKMHQMVTSQARSLIFNLEKDEVWVWAKGTLGHNKLKGSLIAIDAEVEKSAFARMMLALDPKP